MKKLYFKDLAKCVGWEKQGHYVKQFTNLILFGSRSEFIMVPDEDYEEAMRTLEARRAYEELISRTVQRNNDGSALEKQGRIEEAITLYEQNINEGYPATHSFERLMVLYRKRKEYGQEARVIRRAIEVFSDGHHDGIPAKYNQRLSKVEAMMARQQ